MNVSNVILGDQPRGELRQAADEDAALRALVDVTRRRLEVIEKQHVPSTGDYLAQRLIEGVYAVILGVTLAAWTVIGFVVWVPLLVRHTAFLAGTVFYCSLIRDQLKVAEAQGRVQFAARFYARGFEHFLEFYRRRREPEAPVGLVEPLTTMTRGGLLAESALILAVWVAIVYPITSLVAGLR